MNPRLAIAQRSVAFWLTVTLSGALAVAAPLALVLRPGGHGAARRADAARPTPSAEAPATPLTEAPPSTPPLRPPAAPRTPAPSGGGAQAPLRSPLPPGSLTAAAGDGQVRLSWRPSPSGPVYHWVRQRDMTAGSGWQRLPLPLTKTSMTAGYLTNGHTYQFSVVAENLRGYSGSTNVASATPQGGGP